MSPNSAKDPHSSINIDAWSKLENQNFTAELPLNYITLTRTNLPVFTLLSELPVSLNFAAKTSYIKQLSKQPTVPALEAFWRDRDRSLEAVKRVQMHPGSFSHGYPVIYPKYVMCNAESRHLFRRCYLIFWQRTKRSFETVVAY